MKGENMEAKARKRKMRPRRFNGKSGNSRKKEEIHLSKENQKEFNRYEQALRTAEASFGKNPFDEFIMGSVANVLDKGLFTEHYEAVMPDVENIYEKAKTLQWNATTALNWDLDIDTKRFPPKERVAGSRVLSQFY